MPKTFIALLSFAAGVCLTIVSINVWPTVNAQSVSGMTINTNGKATSVFGADPQAVPIVNPLNPAFVLTDVGITRSSKEQLDGMSCHGCTFTDAVLTYGGGAFDLKKVSISGTTRLRLTGAAANTVALLDLLKGIQLDRPSKSPPKLKDIERIAKPKKPINKLDFSPPFGGGTFIGPGL